MTSTSEHPALSLVRLAIIDLDCSTERWEALKPNVDDKYDEVAISVIAAEASNDRVSLTVAAITELDHPKLTADAAIVVPDQPRQRAELAIQQAADLLSVNVGAGRSIRSPFPLIAFQAQNDAGARWLGDARSIDFSGAQDQDRTLWLVRLHPDVKADLSDRRDGVSLLAEALSQVHPSGQVHDYMRLFERAFASAAGKLPSLLADFLDEEFRCDRQETKHWVKTRNRGESR
jgi:hypothetical protein